MKALKVYCRGHAWCRDLMVVATLFAIAAGGAALVVQAFPTAPAPPCGGSESFSLNPECFPKAKLN